MSLSCLVWSSFSRDTYSSFPVLITGISKMEDYEMPLSPDFLEALTLWAESELQKMGNKTCDTSEAVSSSVSEQKQDSAVPRSHNGNITATLHDRSTAPEKPKGKARVVFTERQLNILVCHFNVKLYYEPREMKKLAEMTGLTYKQVKTWFQNRRSKFRKRSHSQHVNQSHFIFRERDSPFMRINNQAHYPHPVALPQWTFPNSHQMSGQNEFNPIFF